MNPRPKAADGYLFVILAWAKHVGMDVSRWSALNSFFDRVFKREAVQNAMKAEGLIK